MRSTIFYITNSYFFLKRTRRSVADLPWVQGGQMGGGGGNAPLKICEKIVSNRV